MSNFCLQWCGDYRNASARRKSHLCKSSAAVGTAQEFSEFNFVTKFQIFSFAQVPLHAATMGTGVGFGWPSWLFS